MAEFNYQVISEKGMPMSDGLKVPDYADGMASFQGPHGKIILIRNHEIGHYDKLDKLLKLGFFKRAFTLKLLNSHHSMWKNKS